jgi:glucokinase
VDRVLALDIGGTKLAAGVMDRAGELLSFVRTPTRVADGPRAVVNRLLKLGDEALATAGNPEFAATGIGCGAPLGPLDPATGRVLGPHGLPGWDEVPIIDMGTSQLSLFELMM